MSSTPLSILYNAQIGDQTRAAGLGPRSLNLRIDVALIQRLTPFSHCLQYSFSNFNNHVTSIVGRHFAFQSAYTTLKIHL